MLNFLRARRIRRQLAALDACPLPQALDLTQARKVLVFAPHPDDETLGCGGTLARLALHCPVKVVLVTDGSGAGGLPPGADTIRQAEFVRALAVLGRRIGARFRAVGREVSSRVPVERNAYYDELKIYDGLEQAAD